MAFQANAYDSVGFDVEIAAVAVAPWRRIGIRYEGRIRLRLRLVIQAHGQRIGIGRASVHISNLQTYAVGLVVALGRITPIKINAKASVRGEAVHLWLHEDLWLLGILDLVEAEEEAIVVS